MSDRKIGRNSKLYYNKCHKCGKDFPTTHPTEDVHCYKCKEDIKGNKPIQAGNSYGVQFLCSHCEFPKNDTLTWDMKYCWNCGCKLDWDEWNK